MKVVGYIFLGLLVAILGLVGIALTKPKEFRVERSVTTTASAAAVYAIMSDLHRFYDWSPYVKYDPQAKTSFGDVPQGLGASTSWEGNSDVGAGRMTIVGLVPD